MPFDVKTLPHQDVLVVHAHGRITKEDYKNFEPQLDDKIREHGHGRLLMVLESDFEGWDPSGLIEDRKEALKHFGDMRRVAVLGEHGWEKMLTAIAKPFHTAEVKYFDKSQHDEAIRWLAEASPPGTYETAGGRQVPE